MKKLELVYMEILKQVMEDRNKTITQACLAKALDVSLSTINHALKPLKKMNSIKVATRNFKVINPKKILYYWASIRNLEKDIIYRTRVNKGVIEIEKNMPNDIEYGAYSAYKFKFKEIPADYSEIYVYSDNIEEIKKRFKENMNNPNLFVLRKDFKKVTIALIFVDLWNLKEWYARDFLNSMEEKINGLLA